MIDCEMKKQITFENSDEYLPLTRPGYNYLECTFFCDEDSCEFENEQGSGQSILSITSKLDYLSLD